MRAAARHLVVAACLANLPRFQAPDSAARQAVEAVEAEASPATAAGRRVLQQLTPAEPQATIRRRLVDMRDGREREFVVGRTYEQRGRRLQASTTDTIEALTLVEDLVYVEETDDPGPWRCIEDTFSAGADPSYVAVRWGASGGNPECMGAAAGGCQSESDPSACEAHVRSPTGEAPTVCTTEQVADGADHWCALAAGGAIPAWPASALVCHDAVPTSEDYPDGFATVPCTKVDLRFSLRDDSSLGGFMVQVFGTSIYEAPVRCADYVPGDATTPSSTCPIGCVFTPASDEVAATTASCTGVADTPTESCTAPTCSVHNRDIGPDRPNLALTPSISCEGILGSSENPLTGCAYTAPSPEVVEDCAATNPDVEEACEAVDTNDDDDVTACGAVALGVEDTENECMALTYPSGVVCEYTDGTNGCPDGCNDDGQTCTGEATPVARCAYTAPTFVDRSCGDLDVTATCDLDAATDGSADCPAGCESTEAYVPACAYSDEEAKTGCPDGCTDDGSTCDGVASEVAATCTGVSTVSYYDESVCEGSGIACTYVAHVPEGSVIPESCDAPTCTLDTPGEATSCTGVETCTETQATVTESCVGADERCDDVELGNGFASAQACRKITVDPPCQYTQGTDGCPAGCVDNGVTCAGWRDGVDTGDPVMVCTYTSGHVDADEQACAAVTMGTTLSKPECEAVRTSADILTPACTYTPPNYGCIYTSDATPTCDLDPNTDGTAECPTGCEEVADADVIPAVAETCDYPSLGSNPGDPMSNTVFTPFRVSVNTGVNNYECWNGYIPGTAEIPSTTCTPGCYFVPAVDYVAPVPEICNGTAANPSMTCDVDPTTDGTDVYAPSPPAVSSHANTYLALALLLSLRLNAKLPLFALRTCRSPGV